MENIQYKKRFKKTEEKCKCPRDTGIKSNIQWD